MPSPRRPTRSPSSPPIELVGAVRSARRTVRVLGDRLQPRVRAPPRAVRDAQDHARGGRDRAWAARGADAGLARCGARLVVRRRHRARGLADAPARAPGDYVLASGVPHTVAEFAATAFECVDLEAERYLRVDPALVRAPERTSSVGDPSRARERLGWEPEVSSRSSCSAWCEARPALRTGRTSETDHRPMRLAVPRLPP